MGASFLVCCAPLQSGADRRELGKPDTASSDGGDGSVVDTAEDAEDAGAEVDAPIEAGPCPLDLTSVPIVDVPPTLTTDTHWDCHVRYRLTTVTYVISPATLTISAGTNIVANLESALVVTRGAKLVAEGTATSPIVFSSSPVTGRHTPGGWGGLLLLGDALTNAGDVPLGALGGPTSPDARARYGGTNDSGSCGTLRYVRVEFAGDILPGAVQNSPGLGLAGCGSGTVVDFVQTHLTLDTAIKVWGGSVGLRHVVATRSYGDAIHLTAGFHGRMQFVVAQNDPARDGRGLVLANNDASAKWSAVPRTTPLLYNATFIGAHERASRRADAVVFTRGGFGRIFDSIFLGYGGQAAEFTDEPTGVSDVPAIYGTPDRTDIESSDWYQNGADDSTYFTSAGDAAGPWPI